MPKASRAATDEPATKPSHGIDLVYWPFHTIVTVCTKQFPVHNFTTTAQKMIISVRDALLLLLGAVAIGHPIAGFTQTFTSPATQHRGGTALPVAVPLSDFSNVDAEVVSTETDSVPVLDQPRVGVLLLNLGGPETGDDVEGESPISVFTLLMSMMVRFWMDNSIAHSG